MKKLIFILVLLFAFVTIATAQNTQLQQLKNELAKKDVIIADVKAERNALILRAAELNRNAVAINDGIFKATNLLQKGYDNGKLNYEELRLMGFNIVVDSTNVYQRPKSTKDKKSNKK